LNPSTRLRVKNKNLVYGKNLDSFGITVIHMKKSFIILIIFALLGAIVYMAFLRSPTENNSQNKETNNSVKNNMNHIITIKTNMGEISFMTYDADAPKTVNNFINLAQKGFYDGVIFHRVIDGFMIQGGDPTGTGRGGPGYAFEDELNPEAESYKEGYKKGVVAMANAGPNTNGSQFFIMVADYPLPNNYTIFGKVISGQDVADAISKVKTDANDRPISSVVIEKVTVSESPTNQ